MGPAHAHYAGQRARQSPARSCDVTRAPKRSGGFVATGVSAAVAMVPRVQMPPEIQLAQRLAGNEQVTRDRAVRKLRKYIVARTQQAAGRRLAGGVWAGGAVGTGPGVRRLAGRAW